MSEASVIEIADLDALRARVGAEPFVSGWRTVSAASVQGFADATGDHQWIHLDAERARRESPFGGPIAHGFLTLSLVPVLLESTISLRQRMSVNYGMNRVRFTSPVPVDARVRGRFGVKEVSEVERGGAQVVWDVTIECEGSERPACVAEFITRHYF
ncbi:MAG: MaoC family dehydratase [Paraburkholderia tropica]|uniref:Acyl dehydratase n=1 Tax=Paraburkholderia tropica TaxID=92647 RepID=A0ABX5MPT6_9BURK|nr:MaoC family dehydratase [Paraburkholderia tropica]MDE1141607.1 MaoC family dehydratase [Paraburkholderia tropica]PXX16483.1 acyl dehydratase [Paraburkholderia tropica]PZW82875.1 acyl dehydratase [Paraburkholderia tropica]